eukprot:c19303_g2_i1 orf=418-981(-)
MTKIIQYLIPCFSVFFSLYQHCSHQYREHFWAAMASLPGMEAVPQSQATDDSPKGIGFVGVHHVGFICENLERSLEFYCGVLGLEISDLRPDKSLYYRGAWLLLGNQMIHLMELPNPDPVSGRPLHGGEDRHVCVYIQNPDALKLILKRAGISYTESQSVRPQIFIRDPDGNALEFQPSNVQSTPKE